MARKTEAQFAKNRKEQADRMRRIRAQEAEIGSIPLPLNQERRDKCAENLELFATTYHEDIFYNPVTDEQSEDFKTIQYAIKSGGLFALGAPRGDGKTTRFKIGLLWAILNGHCRFGVLITAESGAATELMDFFKVALETNDMLFEDYPEACVPVRMLEGSAGRSKAQTIDGQRTHLKWSKDKIVMPTVEGSICSGSVIGVTSIEGRVRGMHHNVAETGETIRPDFVLLDDPQTDETARSQTQVQKRIDIIKKSILNLAGQGRSVTCVMAATIIEKYDLAYRILDRTEHPEWQGVLRKMMASFPDDMEFWESEYHEAYIKSLELQDDQAYVNSFYEEHRERLEAGAKVNNEHRLGEYDITALQHAMHIYFRVGRQAFYCEYQNEPLDDSGSMYTITPKMICSRTNGCDRGILPNQAKNLIAMADVNYIGLNWVATGFDLDFTSYVVDYGKYPSGSKMLFDPEKDTEKTAKQAISKGIVELILFFMEKEFGNHQPLDLLLIDANYETKTVHKTIAATIAKHKPPFKVLAHRGRSFKYYGVKAKTLASKPADECHIEYYELGKSKYPQVVQNSDYWRMTAQKAFLSEPGVDGSCSLFGNRPIDHDAFAREICAERLDNFASTEKGNMYVWNLTPGQNNDKLDALVGTFAGASLLGCSFAGRDTDQRTRSKPSKKPKPNTGKPKGAIRRKY